MSISLTVGGGCGLSLKSHDRIMASVGTLSIGRRFRLASLVNTFDGAGLM